MPLPLVIPVAAALASVLTAETAAITVGASAPLAIGGGSIYAYNKSKKSAAKREELNKRLEESEKKLEVVEKAREDLETKVKDLTEEITALRGQNALLTEETSALRAQNERLEEQFADSTNGLKRMNWNLIQETTSLQARNERLEARTKALEEANADLKWKYAHVVEENRRITAENSEFKDTISKLEVTVASQTDQLNDMGKMMVEQNQRWESRLDDQEEVWKMRLVDQEALWEVRMTTILSSITAQQTRNDQDSWQQRSRSSSASEQAM